MGGPGTGQLQTGLDIYSGPCADTGQAILLIEDAGLGTKDN
jgi:hypothetical protein